MVLNGVSCKDSSPNWSGRYDGAQQSNEPVAPCREPGVHVRLATASLPARDSPRARERDSNSDGFRKSGPLWLPPGHTDVMSISIRAALPGLEDLEVCFAGFPSVPSQRVGAAGRSPPYGATAIGP